MKKCLACLLFAFWASPLLAQEMKTDWAYHAIGSSSRWTETVPGESFTFLANGSDQVGNDDTITLYLLTDQDFAGDMDEQIYVRWWDGTMSHWIMGSWVKNVFLDAEKPETQFHNQPTKDSICLDLWKVEIPSWITQPGENFYAIQMKGFSSGSTNERYLLSKMGGDFSRTNFFGQVWSASEEFDGQDWMINVWQ